MKTLSGAMKTGIAALTSYDVCQGTLQYFCPRCGETEISEVPAKKIACRVPPISAITGVE